MFVSGTIANVKAQRPIGHKSYERAVELRANNWRKNMVDDVADDYSATGYGLLSLTRSCAI